MTTVRSADLNSGLAAARVSGARTLPVWRSLCLVPLLVGAACSSSSDGTTTDSPGASDIAATVTAAAGSATEAADPASTPGEVVDSAATTDSISTEAATTDAAPATDGEPASSAVAVPEGQTSMVVESNPEQYFALYVRPDADSTVEIPVAVVRGEAGSTTLTDHRKALPEDRYRVETMSVSDPGDVDGDGIDDLTELDDSVGSNPINGAPAMDIDTGAVIIPDRATFETLSYQGDNVARDSYLAGLEYVKFWIVDTDTPNPKVYFMNTNNHNAHPPFGELVGISEGRGGRGPQPGKMRGDIVFAADETAPDGTIGRYRFAFQPSDAYTYAEIAVAFEALVNAMPDLGTKLYYYPFPDSALPLYEAEQALYEAGRVPVLVE